MVSMKIGDISKVGPHGLRPRPHRAAGRRGPRVVPWTWAPKVFEVLVVMAEQFRILAWQDRLVGARTCERLLVRGLNAR